MRMAFGHRTRRSRVVECGVEPLLQRRDIGAHAFAFAIEPRGSCDGVGHAGTRRSAKQPQEQRAENAAGQLRHDESRRIGGPDAGETCR